MSNKYSQKLLNSSKKSTKDSIKTDSRWAIKKNAEAACDSTDNKIADKITSILKLPNELHSKEPHSQNEDEWKIYISRKKRTSYWWIKISVII